MHAPRSPRNGARQIVHELAKASDATGGLIAVRKESAGRTSFFRFLSRAAAEAADAAINADTKAAALAVVAVSDKQGASTGSKAAGKAAPRKRRATASIEDNVAVVDSAAMNALREKVTQTSWAAAAASAVSTSSRGLSEVAQVRKLTTRPLTSRRTAVRAPTLPPWRGADALACFRFPPRSSLSGWWPLGIMVEARGAHPIARGLSAHRASRRDVQVFEDVGGCRCSRGQRGLGRRQSRRHTDSKSLERIAAVLVEGRKMEHAEFRVPLRIRWRGDQNSWRADRSSGSILA